MRRERIAGRDPHKIMGLYIASPQDAYTLRNTNVSWQGVTGQTGYELMYRLKSASAWNTLGVVNSANAYASLAGICDKVESNGYAFNEIQYRVKVYTSVTNGGETTTGVWYSNACNLMFRPDTKAVLKAKKGEGTINIPLYEKSVLASGKKLNAKAGDSTVLAAPLVSTAHPLKSGVRLSVAGQTLDAAADTPVFTATGIGSNAYMTVSGSYYGYMVGTGSTTGYYYRSYVMGPDYYQSYWQYYYICGYYYVYSGALYYMSTQYTYSQTSGYTYYSGSNSKLGYYTYYRTGYYYYSGFSAGWIPVFTYGYYLSGSGYYYYYGSSRASYSYNYSYYYGANNTYSYSYYLAG